MTLISRTVFRYIALTLVVLVTQLAAGFAQTAEATRTPSGGASQKGVGTVTAVTGNQVKLKGDTGADLVVLVPAEARVVRLLPGQTDLKTATPIQVQDVQVGDRMLFRGKLGDDGTSFVASSVIVMKQSDLAQKQQLEREEWQKHGVGGLVRAVDAATGTLTISTSPKDTVAVHTSKDTGFLRYASGSVKFSDAKTGTFDQIKVGDQLRARGTRSEDGKELAAQQIISGSFRNIAGTINSVDAANSSITIMDLLTKKSVVVKIATASQMRSLPAPVAQRIAMILKGPVESATVAVTPAGSGTTKAPEGGDRGGSRYGNGRAGGASDFQQILSRMPEIKLADLQKGEAVMIVSTEPVAGSEVTVITLLTGVEPILTSPSSASGAANLLSSWSLSVGDSAQ